MNDDFLHRIRVDPPPRFVASLKARLAQLESETPRRRPIWWRGLFLGSLIAATALATGLFLAGRMYDVSSSALPCTRILPIHKFAILSWRFGQL